MLSFQATRSPADESSTAEVIPRNTDKVSNSQQNLRRKNDIPLKIIRRHRFLREMPDREDIHDLATNCKQRPMSWLSPGGSLPTIGMPPLTDREHDR
jgi:hypothetical protein